MTYDVYFAFMDINVFLDIVLTALIIGLIGVFGYVFIISSMKTDREEAIRKKYGSPNLWDRLSGQTNKVDPEAKKPLKSTLVSLIIVGVLAVLIVVVIIIKALVKN